RLPALLRRHFQCSGGAYGQRELHPILAAGRISPTFAPPERRRQARLPALLRMLIAVFVAARIVANPISNALQKRLTQHTANPIFIIAVTHALLTPAVLPVALSGDALRLGGEFWFNITLCASLAVASNVLLVFALRTSDLSVLGPINAYKSVVSLALGIFLIGELPAPLGLAGVLLIVAGSYFVVDRDAGKSRHLAVAQFLGERGV